MKIAIVAPAYNEERSIKKFLDPISKVKTPVFVVDDGSTDDTANIVKKYNITLIRHQVNLGKGAAMKTGAEAAFSKGFDAVIFMDCDGQHDVKDLQKFIQALYTNYDIVLGSRNMGMGVPLVRYMGNKFASVLVALLFKIYVSDLICGYRAITKKAYGKIKWDSSGYGVETEMVIRLSKTKLTRCEVPVSTVYLDSFKGVSILDAVSILFNVIWWKIKL